MKHLIDAGLLLIVCGCLGALAQEEAAPVSSFPGPVGLDPVSPSVEMVPDVKPVEPGDGRDPFWPVGFVPKPSRQVVSKTGGGEGKTEMTVVPVGPQWEEARRKLDVRGVSLISRNKTTQRAKYIAMMAGKVVEEGDTVSVTHNGQVYRWKITGISPAGISLQKLDRR